MNTAEDRSQWPSVEIVSAPIRRPAPITNEQHTFITLARGAARLLLLAAQDMENRALVGADRDRHQAYELVQKLGPAWLEAYEALCGPAPQCSACGGLTLPGIDECRCDDDICFAEVEP